MNDVFPDIPAKQIHRINLQRQEPGRRGPGSLVHGGLQPYTDEDELMGLCEELGPGRYKAIALDDRGKPLGPAWAYEVPMPLTPAVDETVLQPAPALRAADDELRSLRASHADELDELRTRLEERAERELAAALDNERARSETMIELAKLDASRTEIDAERRIEDIERRSRNELDRLTGELERAEIRHARLQGELDELSRELLKTQTRLNESELRSNTALQQERARVHELESELRTQTRIHETELRELRNGSPEVTSAIARAKCDWDIERAKIMLQSEMDRHAREHSIGAQFMAAMKDEQVQEVAFPLLNTILERLFAQPEMKRTIESAHAVENH